MLLKDYREEIDRIDRQLMELFEQRLDIAKKVADYKLENGIEVFQEEREYSVIEKWQEGMKDKGNKEYAKRFIKELMDISKDLQKPHCK